MKIGIISDIHGYPNQFKKALKIFEGCDIILCGGDVLYHGPRNPILEGYNPAKLVEEIKGCGIPMLIAKGNCDAEVDEMVLGLPILSSYIVYERDGIRFIVTHGHNVDGEKLKDVARTYKANMIITGHTHIRQCEEIEGTLYINPGSSSVPKGDGIASVALIENREIKFINVENGEIIEKRSF
jgi:uncharacterized protein